MDPNKLGLGVMIKILGGNKESVEAYNKAVGKIIILAVLEKDTDTFKLHFKEGTLTFSDDGQSCCESRYMSCDDELQQFDNAVFLKAELRTAPNTIQPPDYYGEHEIQFLHIETSKGVITIANHNEHNGYYGGFAIRCNWYDRKN